MIWFLVKALRLCHIFHGLIDVWAVRRMVEVCRFSSTSAYTSSHFVAVVALWVVIPIKNRWSIIFDWSIGKQSIFFPIFKKIFLPINMPSDNMQHWKSQKKNLSLVFLLIFCYCYWLYRLINFLRQIDRFF